MQIERVKKLHKDLQKPDKNHKHIIEELSEYILYGDHQNEDIFEYVKFNNSYFAENNILSLFYEKIKKADLSLSIFIIERMSMIITNLQKPLNLNYVLSNPVLHDFINHNYDFSHPELVDYYVNFLKTIAIRINRENFYLYFNQRYCTFPLLWQAQKFIDYPDNLVRNTIQNIILSLSKLAADPKQNDCTQSTIMCQNKIVFQFKTYLTKSPFLRVYLKYILQIQNLITSLKNREQLEQLDDLLMFFTDLFTECPFLSQILEQMITNHLVQPILDCLLLNKCKQIKISCELGLFAIYTLLTKLPIVYSIMQYFCEDNIYIDENFQNYDSKANQKWVFDQKNWENEFKSIFQDDQIELSERVSTFLKLKQDNLKPNPYKSEFLSLLRTRDSALLYLQLAIWQVAKLHNYSIPLSNIIKVNNTNNQLLQTQNEIVYSIDVMNAIILLIQNENLKELESIYENLNNIIKKIVEQTLQGKKLEEGLLVNWPIIQEFDWEKFKDSKLSVRLDCINPYQDDIRLLQFKFVYIWMLVKHCLLDFQREKINFFQVNQEINHLERDDEFIKISNTPDVIVHYIQYLILDEKNGYLIHSSPQQNPNTGIIKYVQPLRAIQCSFLENTLILECHKLYQNHFKSYKLQFNADSIKAVINRIYQAQCHVGEQIFIKLQALLG